MVDLKSLKVHQNFSYWWLDKDLLYQWISYFCPVHFRPQIFQMSVLTFSAVAPAMTLGDSSATSEFPSLSLTVMSVILFKEKWQIL